MRNQICKYVIGVKQDPGSNSQLRDEMCKKMLCLLWCWVRWSEIIKSNRNSGELDISQCGVKYNITIPIFIKKKIMFAFERLSSMALASFSSTLMPRSMTFIFCEQAVVFSCPAATCIFSPSVNIFDFIAWLFCHLAKVKHATLVCKFTAWSQEILLPFTQISAFVSLPLHLHKVFLCAVKSRLYYSVFNFFHLFFCDVWTLSLNYVV